jgi:hypothetical protein
MIDDTIRKIETQIEGADAIKDERRRELLQLLGTLRSEIAQLSETHGEDAQSIARFTELSTHEATRVEQNPKLRDLSLKGLVLRRGFEKSHPASSDRRAISNELRTWGSALFMIYDLRLMI